MKRTLVNVLMAASVLSGAAAMADEKKPIYLNFGGVSHHFSDEKFTENNYGLGLEVPVGGFLVGAGVYKNSIGRTSRYIVAEKCMLQTGPLCLGGLAGFVDGYELNSGGFTPMVAPTVTAEAGNFGVRLVYVPEVEKKVAAVVSLQFRVKFNLI